MPDDESRQLQQSWIANADAWTDAVRNKRIESRRLITDAAIVDAVLAQQPRRVLDLGCGEGWLARALAARGIAVTGVDGSQPLIDAARASGGAEFLVLSYDEIIDAPSRAGSEYDVIVANFSLLDDRATLLLAALRSALATNGRLIVQTLHPRDAAEDGWRCETFSAMPGEWRASMPWFSRSIDSWKKTFAGAGYAIEEIREPKIADRDEVASMLFICR